MSDINYNWYRGNNISVGIYGESHSERIGVKMIGLDIDSVDENSLEKFMRRRAPGANSWSTPRKEADKVVIDTCSDKVFEAHICNTNIRPSDYSNLLRTPRPSHADYTARLKYGADYASSGGGAFSGRMTAPICIAGFVALSELERRGIRIFAHIKSIHDIRDESYYDSSEGFMARLHEVPNRDFPTVDADKGQAMIEAIGRVRAEGDSVGGIIEVVVEGMPGGVGGPLFEGIESKISSLCFAVPACKGVEFGNGFGAAGLRGSENNDCFVMEEGEVRLATNRSGGILGGISVGGRVAPIVFDVCIKPTPTISRVQRTVDLETGENVDIEAGGRHDPCIVPRAVPVFEAVTAIAILDFIIK